MKYKYQSGVAQVIIIFIIFMLVVIISGCTSTDSKSTKLDIKGNIIIAKTNSGLEIVKIDEYGKELLLNKIEPESDESYLRFIRFSPDKKSFLYYAEYENIEEIISDNQIIGMRRSTLLRKHYLANIGEKGRGILLDDGSEPWVYAIFSPDGKNVAGYGGAAFDGMVVINLNTLDKKVFGPNSGPLIFSPDSQKLVFEVYDQKPTKYFYYYLISKTINEVSLGNFEYFPLWLDDKHMLLYRVNEAEGSYDVLSVSFIKKNTDTNIEEEINSIVGDKPFGFRGAENFIEETNSLVLVLEPELAGRGPQFISDKFGSKSILKEGTADIFLLSLTNGKLEKLTDAPEYARINHISISPDKKKIAFITEVLEGPLKQLYSIYIVDIVNKMQKKIYEVHGGYAIGEVELVGIDWQI